MYKNGSNLHKGVGTGTSTFETLLEIENLNSLEDSISLKDFPDNSFLTFLNLF